MALEPDVRRRRIQLSSRAAMADQILTAAMKIASVPLSIAILGTEHYGAWLALLAYLALLGLADFGLTSAVVNKLAGVHGAGEVQRARELVATSFYFLLFTGVAITIVLLGVMSALPVEGLVGLGSGRIGDVRLAAAIAVTLTVGLYALQMVIVISHSFQRGYVSSLSELTGRIVSLGGLLALHLAGVSRLSVFVVAMLAPAAASRMVVLAVYAWRDDHVSLAPRDMRLEVAREVAGTSMLFLASGASEMLFTQTPTLILANVGGAALVPSFAVPYLLFFNAYSLIGVLNGPLWPAVAEAHRTGDLEWIRLSFRRALRRTARIALAIFVPLALLTRPIVGVWTGGTVTVSFGVTVLLAVHFSQASMNYAEMVFLTALGFVKERVASVVGLGGLGLVLNIILAPRYGVFGVVLAMFGAMLFSQTWFLPLMLRRRAAFLHEPNA